MLANHDWAAIQGRHALKSCSQIDVFANRRIRVMIFASDVSDDSGTRIYTDLDREPLSALHLISFMFLTYGIYHFEGRSNGVDCMLRVGHGRAPECEHRVSQKAVDIAARFLHRFNNTTKVAIYLLRKLFGRHLGRGYGKA